MDQNEKDILVGALIRESKKADSDLQHLLVKAKRSADTLEKLVEGLRRFAYEVEMLPTSEIPPHLFGVPSNYELAELEKEVRQARARVSELNDQKRRLGLDVTVAKQIPVPYVLGMSAPPFAKTGGTI